MCRRWDDVRLLYAVGGGHTQRSLMHWEKKGGKKKKKKPAKGEFYAFKH